MLEKSQFQKALQQVFDSMENFMELTRETEHPMVTEDGVQTYLEETGKYPFQVADQFHRPNEYLRCLLDMVQANFEPDILGTFFLNSNMCFLFDSLPADPFSLGYLSMIKSEEQSWDNFLEVSVAKKLQEYGYLGRPIKSTFVVVSADEKYSVDLVEETNRAFDISFSVDEALALLRGQADQKPYYIGYCHDKSLLKKVRVSFWFIFNC